MAFNHFLFPVQSQKLFDTHSNVLEQDSPKFKFKLSMRPPAGNCKASLETSSWPWAGRQQTRGHLSCSLQSIPARATLDSWFTSHVNKPLLTDLMIGLIYLCLRSLYIHSCLPSAPCLLGLIACDGLYPFAAYPEVFPFFLTIVLTVVCPIITRYSLRDFREIHKTLKVYPGKEFALDIAQKV